MPLKVSPSVLASAPDRTLLLHILHKAQEAFVKRLNVESANAVLSESEESEDAELASEGPPSTDCEQEKEAPNWEAGGAAGGKKSAISGSDLHHQPSPIDLSKIRTVQAQRARTGPVPFPDTRAPVLGDAHLDVPPVPCSSKVSASNATYVALLYSYLLSLIVPEPGSGTVKIRYSFLPCPKIETDSVAFASPEERKKHVRDRKKEFYSLATFALRPFAALIDRNVPIVPVSAGPGVADREPVGPGSVTLSQRSSRSALSSAPSTSDASSGAFPKPMNCLVAEALKWLPRSRFWYHSQADTNGPAEPVLFFRRVQADEACLRARRRDQPGWIMMDDRDRRGGSGSTTSKEAKHGQDTGSAHQADSALQTDFTPEAEFTRSDIVAAVHFLIEAISSVTVGEYIDLPTYRPFGHDVPDGYGVADEWGTYCESASDGDDEHSDLSDDGDDDTDGDERRPGESEEAYRWRQQRVLLFKLMMRLCVSDHARE